MAKQQSDNANVRTHSCLLSKPSSLMASQFGGKKLASVQVVEWRKCNGKPAGETDLTFNRTDGTKVSLHLVGDAAAVLDARKLLPGPLRRKTQGFSRWRNLMM